MHIVNVGTGPGKPAACRPSYLFNDWQRHGRQVAALARGIAQELGLSGGSAARVDKAARSHDIGKSKLPNIFDDAENPPETLSPEQELLMSHTWLGYRILRSQPNPDSWAADAALLHHEWWNGDGYPLGLARTDIPLVARIVAVADAYGTLLGQRPYPGSWHVAHVLNEIKRAAGTQFDPDCVDALVTLIRCREPGIVYANPAAGPVAN